MASKHTPDLSTLSTYNIAAIVAVVLGSTACGRDGTHAVVLFDRSTSASAGCRSVVGVARDLHDRLGRGASLRLTVFGTGDAASAMEPVTIGTYSLGGLRRLLEGRRRDEQERIAVLQQLHADCRAAGRTARSPIALGAYRSIGYLRATGRCGEETCELVIVSDGIETEQADLVRAITHSTSAPTPSTQIDNSNVAVDLCGMSETAGRRSAGGRPGRLAGPGSLAGAERLQATWRSMFTSPDTVRFSPVCPKFEVPAADPGGAAGRP